ncbi:hypothetical protein HBH47_208330 [Parastagonospora nodorum]|nr:hypothetical protein HBH47_208330 [Parastagonospora nodorum]KAH4599417.1 hypothetical protein HBH82_203690 [Parastagonospora nodorum]KAH4670207.1 hypothetical protein HBH78_185080 [Parastagonospora nodorum]KAH4709113.1 hypothetical protein HBH67_059280 [Parastagonospora nodorum]KAH4762456.1 hypothetical protein HBH63_200980 [Parastagonospora nodorum]
MSFFPPFEMASQSFQQTNAPRTPIPRSGAELSVAFYKPGPTPTATFASSGKKPTKQKALAQSPPQYLSRTFLQQDELCEESLDLLPLLGRIFDCSDRLEGYHALHCEQIAGFRYFIPNGRLAAEWRYFFQIIPDHYMQMVPSEVRFAYENQKSLESCSMEGWVEDSLAWTDTQEEERSHPYYRHLRADDEDYALQIPSPQVLSVKRKRNSPEPDGIRSSLLSPRAKRLRTSSPTESDYSKLLRPVQRNAQIPMTTTQASSTPALSHSAVAPHPPQVQATASLGLPPPVASTAPAVTTALAHQLITPRVPIPLSKQARSHPAPPQPPGTVEHTGRGNVSKAWSKERIRAFTQIQGYPRQELPFSAVSEYGDELSRDHTPKSVDPRCCPFPTTIEENLTYMHLASTLNREMCARVKKHWTAQQIVVYTTHALGLQNQSSIVRTKLTKQFQKCVAGFERANPNHVPTASLTNISMESGLIGGDSITHDYFLHAMGKNVVNHPVGSAAQMLTRVIRHVVDVSHDRTARLSEAARYARAWGITVPVGERMNSNLDIADVPDPVALATFRAAYVTKFGHLP